MRIAGVLLIWFGLVCALAAGGKFVREPGSWPLPILIGVVAPLLIALAAFLVSPAFRRIVATADLRLLTSMQAWRFAGIALLALGVQGLLPAAFAWSAGLGDIAIGLTAPWIVLALIRRPEFASGRGFLAWNLAGIADLVGAVSLGALSTAYATGAAGEITMTPMAQLPMVLLPAFFVPLFIVLHVIALTRARWATVTGHSSGSLVGSAAGVAR
jgi:hypothetical protein